MKSRVKILEFPVFSHYIVHVEVTSDIEKSMKKYHTTKEIVEDDFDNRADGITVSVEDDGISYIFLKHNSSVNTIAHESWHVVHRMMSFMGVGMESETIAYHLGYMVEHIFKFLRKRR